MSMVFVPQRLRGKCEINQATIQKLLDENNQLIQCIVEYQNLGKAAECTQYQQILHRNLIYLATIADSSQNVASAHPAPLGQPMGMGPVGMEPVPRTVDPMGNGTPPPGPGNPHQMAAGAPFPHGQTHYQQVNPSTSVSLPAGSQGNMGSFNQPVASPQGMPAQEQLGLSVGSTLATHLQPGVQQGPGSGWYGPQQGQFQQNPGAHQQTFYQQYITQQPVTSTPQEFNSAQNSQGQFRSFQQDPGQQYVSYRTQQPAPTPGQQQAFPYGQGAAFGGFQ
ncbi:protein SSXT-like isoform X2 [Amblyraja radiata]|uniref:protein SSXT-like isoform X2 n=1 Tax=Amblyraja radiata TaxID=386614 RepID=UPI0014032E00|nr:protein SSXT-like isoform X2 [Amblyraja radiata]